MDLLKTLMGSNREYNKPKKKINYKLATLYTGKTLIFPNGEN